MSTYKELKGLRVKYVPTDTTAPSTAASGDVWYNTTTSQLKAYVGISAWASSAPYAQVMAAGGTNDTGMGTQTAALVTIGNTPPGTFVATAEYNGSGWAAGGNLNTGRYQAGGAGTQTAGLVFGGTTGGDTMKDETEEYDGSSWTESGDLNTARRALGRAGTQTAGLAFGGSNPASTEKNETEEYNGTSWSEQDNLSDARDYMASLGIQTAAFAISGESPSLVATVEEYNGSSWTSGTNINTARFAAGAGGTTSAGIIFGGGEPGISAKSESWDGTSWSEGPDLGTGRKSLTGAVAAPSTLALAMGGEDPSDWTGATEEYNNSFQVITAGAWASGGAMPVAVYAGASFGIQTSAVHSGGVPPANQAANNTYEYNGSAWSSGGALPANRQQVAGAGASETSGLAFCGSIPTNNQPSFTFHNNTYEYDGSSWTSGGNYTATLTGVGGAGTQTAAIGAGGTSTAPGAPGMTNTSATYNGSSWTAGPNTGTSATRPNMVTGTTTSAVSIANTPPFGCEEFDGSSWTTGGAPISAGYSRIHTGTSNSDALVAGGDATPRAQCESYNGTAWATSPNLGVARANMGSARGVAPTAAAIVFGGSTPPGNHNQTEEFTGETTADTASTIDFD